MLNECIMEKLRPQVMNVMPERNYGDIDEFFKRVYLVDYDETRKAFVMGYWGDPNPVICFDVESYLFIGVLPQDYVLEHGVLV